jgi:hypothetical protein
MNYLYRIVRYPGIYLTLSTLLVLLSMSVAASLVIRDIEGDREIPLVQTLGSYAATLEDGTVNSRAMGAAILFGLENQDAKKLALGKLPPDAPAVLSALNTLRTLYLADTALLVNKHGLQQQGDYARHRAHSVFSPLCATGLTGNTQCVSSRGQQ